MPKRILLIEDDPTLRLLTVAYLRRDFEVSEASNATQAWELYTGSQPEVVIIDVGLPDGSGLDLGRSIRARDAGVGIIFLTSAGDKETKLAGFAVGADDYVTKPFEPEELTARIAALLRRHAPVSPTSAELLRLGSLTMDRARREVSGHSGSRADLTKAEFDVLAALLDGRGKVLSRMQLLDAISTDPDHDASERYVDVVISSLRRKLNALTEDEAPILTVRGIGYRSGYLD